MYWNPLYPKSGVLEALCSGCSVLESLGSGCGVLEHEALMGAGWVAALDSKSPLIGQLAVQAEVSVLTAPQLVTSQPCPLSRLPTCSRIYRPSFRENKPKTLVFNE